MYLTIFNAYYDQAYLPPTRLTTAFSASKFSLRALTRCCSAWMRSWAASYFACQISHAYMLLELNDGLKLLVKRYYKDINNKQSITYLVRLSMQHRAEASQTPTLPSKTDTPGS